MKVDWIVTADLTSAKIYSIPASKYKREITLIKELNHAEGKMKAQDLVTDKPGIYRAGHEKGGNNNNAKGFAPGHYAPRTDPKEIETDKFAKKISDILEHAHSMNQYQKLILVAAPHFLGSLNKNLSKEVKKSVEHTISKDGIHIADSALQRLIQSELVPAAIES